MIEAPISNEILSRTAKICRLPEKFRTAEEIGVLSQILSKFDIFRSKVSEEKLPEVLRAAAMNVKFLKVPAGQFLYHKDESSQCIYFILKGEGWKFRPKTENELEREANVVRGRKACQSNAIPKMLETIRLATASKERDRLMNIRDVSDNGNESNPQMSLGNGNKVVKSVRSLTGFDNSAKSLNEIVTPIIENILDSDRSNNNENVLKEQSDNYGGGRLKTNLNSLVKKIMNKRDVLNFENDYFANIIKRDDELSSKYIKNNANITRFDKKICPGEVVGEMSMSLSYARNSSVFAYSSLYIIYLDQKGYEKTFSDQIDGVREKLQFFMKYFPDVMHETLRRMCYFFKEQRSKIGDIIYREADASDNIYFIKSGEVQLTKILEEEQKVVVGYERGNNNLVSFSAEPGKSYKNAIVASVIDGCFFGEEVLFKKSIRDYTAKSVSNLLCYTISTKILNKLPKHMIQMLHDSSVSKQSWRGDRLRDMTNGSTPSVSSSLALKKLVSPKHTSVEKDLKLNVIDKQSRRKMIMLDKSLDKRIEFRKQRESSTDATTRSLNELDEHSFRFKIQTKNTKEEKNSYVIKFLSPNAKKQPLSVWKRNLSNQKERQAYSRTSCDNRSRSTSKDDHNSQIINVKESYNSPPSKTSKSDIRTTLFKISKSGFEHTSALLKNENSSSKESLRGFLIKNLQNKSSKELIEKDPMFENEQLINNSKCKPDVKKSFDALLQSIVYTKSDKVIQSLNDLKPKSKIRSPIKHFTVKESTSNNQIVTQSLSNLDSFYTSPSLIDLNAQVSQHSLVMDENRGTFTTVLSSPSYVKGFSVRKLRAKHQ